MLGYFPDSHIGYLYQARVSVIKGDMELAMALYEEALAKITQDTESVSVGLEMLNLLANLRRWDRFDAIAPDIRKKTSSYPRLRSQFHTIIARREEMRQRFQAALSELELADTAYPLDDRIAMRKAAIYKKTGDNDKAAMEYRKALRINPGNGPAATALQELEASADRAMSLSDHSPVGTIHK
jgi:tetratricopeptide (TPR) repeat protein